MANRILAGFLTLFISVSTMAAEKGLFFDHNDWELACDNTRTCRAAGYAAEEGVGSVLLTRLAGPNAVIRGEIMKLEPESDTALTVPQPSLWIDGLFVGNLRQKGKGEDYWLLTPKQASAIAHAIKGNGKVEFKGGSSTFLLSGKGAYAIFLKMDEFQGRIGTPGALTRVGDKPEAGVKAALPVPVIRKARVIKSESRNLTEQELTRLLPALTASLSAEENCDVGPSNDPADGEAAPISLQQLDSRHSLLSVLCWRAAYNEGYGFWLIDHQLQKKPQLITTSGSIYEDGEIFMSHKGRGPGDCWGIENWVWDGKIFRKSEQKTTGRCNSLILGGTWDLPTLVSEVKR
ncbi:TPA: DUF1176 domain-containing protein [Klebsiella aerogenes]|nr:DUF1176 domain-containing protein [Klebsiella aerogenes]